MLLDSQLVCKQVCLRHVLPKLLNILRKNPTCDDFECAKISEELAHGVENCGMGGVCPLIRVNPGSIFGWGLIFMFGGLVNFFKKF
jgi:hypothetical protein